MKIRLHIIGCGYRSVKKVWRLTRLRSHKWEIAFWLKQHMFGVVFIGKMCSCVNTQKLSLTMGSLLFPARTQKDKGAKSNSKSCKGMWTEMLPSSSFAEQGPGAKKLKHLKTQKMNGGEDWGNNFVISKTSFFLGGGRVHRKYLVVYMAWISNDTSLLMDSSLSADMWVPLATPPCHGFIIPENLENGSKTKVSFFLNLDLYHGHSGKWHGNLAADSRVWNKNIWTVDVIAPIGFFVVRLNKIFDSW